jgi:uncharacterized protein YbjQ (UPF0145 family)
MTTQSPYRGAVPAPSAQIVVTTGPDVPGFRITEVLAVVHGVAMRPSETGDASASRMSVLQGTRATRDAAASRLLDEARGLGANAIIGMRYDSSGDEICAYGTAVRIAPWPA